MPTFRYGSSPAIAVTLGDPAGIGPEVTLKALSRLPKPLRKKIVLIGNAAFYTALSHRLGLKFSFQDVKSPRDFMKVKKSIPCYFEESVPVNLKRGRYDKKLTQMAVRSIKISAKLAMQGLVAAIVTAPINKANLKKAGFDIPGHTEFLAKLSGTKKFEMMLVGGNLRVVLVTRHTPLRDVSQKITKKKVEETIQLAAKELKNSFGIRKPRLVVCGLNPHAGEEGSIGKEEIRVIAPAVKAARKKVNAVITGPLSPDALFYDAYEGRYDAEICMYHDQGLIPLKMISRGAGVNVTLGLPFVRTSPDHGTAYDIAGRFKADSGSMEEAIKLAEKISLNRRRG